MLLPSTDVHRNNDWNADSSVCWTPRPARVPRIPDHHHVCVMMLLVQLLCAQGGAPALGLNERRSTPANGAGNEPNEAARCVSLFMKARKGLANIGPARPLAFWCRGTPTARCSC